MFTYWDVHWPILVDADKKDRHFWFWSRTPSCGKTTLLHSLFEEHEACFWNYEEKYQQVTSKTQFLLFDEYNAQLKATQLNAICSGSYMIPVKGGEAVRLHSPTVVVCGNKPIVEVYPNLYETVKTRFVEKDVNKLVN